MPEIMALLLAVAFSASMAFTGAASATPAPPRLDTTTGPTYTNADSFSISLSFDTDVINVDVSDFTVVGTTATITSLTGSGSFYLATLSGGDLADLNGQVTIRLDAGQDIQSLGGEPLVDLTTVSEDPVRVNNTPPNCAFSTAATAPVTDVFTIDITCTPQADYADTITAFDASDLVVGNATIENFTFASSGTYAGSVDLRPSSTGSVTLDLPAGTVYDEAGNLNTASTQFSISADVTVPTVTFNPYSSFTDHTYSAPFTMDVRFSENVTGFDPLTDLVMSNAAVSVQSSSSRTWTLTVTPAAEGAFTLDLPAGVAVDADGFGNLAATQFAGTYDTTPPVFTLSSTVTAPATANFLLDIHVSESVHFQTSYLTVGNGTVSGLTGSGTDYQVTVRPTFGTEGVVTVDLAADKARDAAGNGNLAATQFAVAYDFARPDVESVVRTSPASEVTNADSLTFTVTFTEDVTWVDAADFEIRDDQYIVPTTATISQVNPISPSVYELTVSGGNLASIGGNYSVGDAATLTVRTLLSATISDLAGLTINSVTAQNAQEYYAIDNTDPTLEITGPASAPASFTATFTFDEDVTGFHIGDIFAGNATLANFSGSGDTYTVEVTSTGSPVTLDVAAAAASDEAGNASAEATQYSAVFDVTAPTVLSVERYSPASANTNANTLVWRVTFSEPVTGIDVNDFDVDGSTASINSVTRSTDEIWDVTVTGGDLADYTGNVTLRFDAAQDIEDANGNPLTDTVPSGSNEDTYSVSHRAPVLARVTRNLPAAETTNADSLTWDFQFSSISTSFDLAASDFVITGTTASLDVVRYSIGFYVTASGGDLAALNGPVTIAIDGSQGPFLDEFGNALDSTSPSGANENSYTIDNAAPSVTLGTGSSDPVSGAFALAVNFSEDVTGLALADLVVGNGTASDLAGSGAGYTVNITPSADGDVTVDLAAGVATDTAGNENSAAAQFVIGNDGTAPTVALSTASSDPVSGAFSLTIAFSEDVTGFSLSDLTIANGTASNLTGSGAEYTATITPSADGNVTVDIAAGAAEDAAGNLNLAATQFVIGTDGTAPTVALSTTSSNPVSGAFTLTIAFSEDVTGFTLSDLAVGNGTASNLTGSGADYTVTITPSSERYVTVDIAAGAAADVAGNESLAATQFSIGIDATSPTVTLSTGASDPVSGAFTLGIDFSEGVTGLELADLIVGNGTASNLTSTGRGDAMVQHSSRRTSNSYRVTITPSADGDVTVDLAADAAFDAAGNGNLAAAQFVISSDGTAPTVVLSTEVSDPVSGAFVLAITFSEDVTGLALSELTVGNGTASSLEGSGTDYSVTITPSGEGDVTIDLAAGVAADAAGNDNLAATQFVIGFDTTSPTVVLASDAVAPAVSAFTLTVTFSEAVTGLALDDFVAANADLSDLTGGDADYQLTVTPTGGNPITVDLPADTVLDLAGNGNTAAEQFSIITDNTAPVLVIELPGSETEGPFTASFTFSEDVTGFAADDIVVTNADLSDFTQVSATQYTVLATPQTIGSIDISVAADAAQDGAGNGSEAASASIDAVAAPIEVSVEIGDDTGDVTDVSAVATISNPGSQPVAFEVQIDVPWLTVDPLSGTIPALGDLNLTISVNALAEDLAPGTYSGTVTVVNLSGGGAAARGPNATTHADGDTIVVKIPVTVAIAERRGTIQLVATTPGGLQRDESFAFSSTDSDFDELTLTTQGGTASTAALRKLFGTYDITQAVPQGWLITDIACIGDTDNGSVIDVASGRVDIDLDPGEDIVCTFTNARDNGEIRLATRRAIHNFMVRRGDRILEAAPDLTRRVRDRDTRSAGHFAADIDGGRRNLSMATSLSGMRNAAHDASPQMDNDLANPDEAGPGIDVWVSANYESISDDRAGEAVDSAFGLVQIGADWMPDDQTVLGVMLQHDWMDEAAGDIAERAGAVRGARVDGAGWMVGPYVVRAIGDGVWLDATAMWGQSDNTIDPLGLYEDSFSTTRYLVRMNLTGEWRSGRWRIRPTAGLAHFEETQAAYTDSLGIDIPQQTIAIGRLRAGPQIAYRFETASGGWWEPSLDLTGIWDYDAAQLLDEDGGVVGTRGLRGDARLGLRGQISPGARLSIETSFSGLGDGDFSANGARLELRIGF